MGAFAHVLHAKAENRFIFALCRTQPATRTGQLQGFQYLEIPSLPLQFAVRNEGCVLAKEFFPALRAPSLSLLRGVGILTCNQWLIARFNAATEQLFIGR